MLPLCDAIDVCVCVCVWVWCGVCVCVCVCVWVWCGVCVCVCVGVVWCCLCLIISPQKFPLLSDPLSSYEDGGYKGGKNKPSLNYLLNFTIASTERRWAWHSSIHYASHNYYYYTHCSLHCYISLS